MKTLKISLLSIILLSVAVSCNNSSKGSSSQNETEPMLTAYHYEIEDVGDGWNLGKVFLAFENIGSTWVPLNRPETRNSGVAYGVEDAYIETQEGENYSIRVYSDFSKFAKAEGGAQKTENWISFSSMPPIPPGFRVSEGLTFYEDGGYAWGRYVLEFRFAKAAHPTVVVFPTKPEWNIDLANVPGELSMPVASIEEDIPSISSLEGTILVDEEDKLQITIGRCIHGYIELIVKNRDKFNSSIIESYFPAMASYTGGKITYKVPQRFNPNLIGPDQTVTYSVSIPLFEDETSHVAIYWSDRDYDLVSTADCH